MLTSHQRLPFGGLKPPGIFIVALAVVFGWLFGHSARWFTDGLAVNTQLYFHAFRINNVHSNWVWAPLRFLSAGVLQYSGLASWAFVAGYLCRRLISHQFSVALGALIVSTFSSMVFTTTSVRIAQPSFFESGEFFILFPVAVNVLFVAVPAGLGARMVQRGSMSAGATALLSLMAIGLAWWNANELSDALTFGCVWSTGSGLRYCTPREDSWGLISAAALTVLGVLTLWDSQRDGARPLQRSTSIPRPSHSTGSDHIQDDNVGDPGDYQESRLCLMAPARSSLQRPMMPPRIAQSSNERLDQLRVLARRLEDRLLVNTRAARADCRTFALQIIELLEIEDGEGRSEPLRPLKREVIERVSEAVRACRESGEQAEPTRLFVMTEHTGRV